MMYWTECSKLLREIEDNHDHGISKVYSELSTASIDNLLPKAISLVENGAEVDHIEYDGNTAVMFAAEYNNLDMIEYLVSKGADLNRENYEKSTALTLAAEFGHFKVIEYLIKAKVNLNHVDKFGRTALMIAASFGYTNIVVALLENGSDYKYKNKFGETAFSTSKRNSVVSKILSKRMKKN